MSAELTPNIEPLLNQAYNQAIDHVLQIIKDRYAFVKSENYNVSVNRFPAKYELEELNIKIEALKKHS